MLARSLLSVGRLAARPAAARALASRTPLASRSLCTATAVPDAKEEKKDDEVKEEKKEEKLPGRHARSLDARHHAGVADADARPILQRLLQYPEVRGDCVGAPQPLSWRLRRALIRSAFAAQ